MTKKIRVAIIFGGKSAEHEVSLKSAKNVIDAIDKNKYEPILIHINKTGVWSLMDNLEFISNNNLIPLSESDGEIFKLDIQTLSKSIDVAFPILHGPFGEDGTIQGFLKLAGIPFVGASVLGSAIGMDKDVMKRLLREAHIPIGKFLVMTEKEGYSFQEIVENLGLPFFVKPANMGSSVGVNKVSNEADFDQAIREAFNYDHKIIIEENIVGREIECSILGNDEPVASLPGEVIPTHDFYSYEAKYIDENGARLDIPARLPEEVVIKIQELAIKTFKILACEGFARVDFFLKDSGDVLVNEINTIPGFTSISMYPKLWEASGISYSELIDRLIRLALERFEKEQKLKTSYDS